MPWFRVRLNFRLGVVLVLVLTLVGCATVSYYSQAVGGHLSIWLKRRDIQKLINNPDTPPKLKKRLILVLSIRQYASHDLSLPDNYSFKSYVALNRKHVVWNVLAAPEFSVKPKRFCFPVVGCLSYKGYYSKKSAIKEANRLKYKGYDVAVGGVNAYSTLGYFSDPVLSTYVYWSEADLAGLLFHELAHQLIYLTGDTAFNESFATAVEIEGVRRWMKKQGQPKKYEKFYRAKQYEDQFMRLILRTREKLKRVYASEQAASKMRQAKKQVFAQLKADYQALKKHWHGYTGYDYFMSRKLNNADIAGAATYFEYVRAFQLLLKKHHGDFASFYQEVLLFGKLTIKQRHVKLKQIIAAAN